MRGQSRIPQQGLYPKLGPVQGVGARCRLPDERPMAGEVTPNLKKETTFEEINLSSRRVASVLPDTCARNLMPHTPFFAIGASDGPSCRGIPLPRDAAS